MIDNYSHDSTKLLRVFLLLLHLSGEICSAETCVNGMCETVGTKVTCVCKEGFVLDKRGICVPKGKKYVKLLLLNHLI